MPRARASPDCWVQEEARPSSDSDRPAEDGDPSRRPMGATEEGRVGRGAGGADKRCLEQRVEDHREGEAGGRDCLEVVSVRVLTRSEGTVFWCLSRKFGKFQNETLGERRALKGETDSFCIAHTIILSIFQNGRC